MKGEHEQLARRVDDRRAPAAGAGGTAGRASARRGCRAVLAAGGPTGACAGRRGVSDLRLDARGRAGSRRRRCRPPRPAGPAASARGSSARSGTWCPGSCRSLDVGQLGVGQPAGSGDQELRGERAGVGLDPPQLLVARPSARPSPHGRSGCADRRCTRARPCAGTPRSRAAGEKVRLQSGFCSKENE